LERFTKSRIGGNLKTIKRILTYPLIAVAAIVMLFEEWLWHRLIRLGDRLARLPLVGHIEAWIAALPPYGALLFFLVPVLILLPIKIIALFLLAHGHGFLGIVTIALAKLIGTAWAARIYHLTSMQLLKIRWFARFHTWFLAKKDALLEWLGAQSPWRAAQAWVGCAKHMMKSSRPGIGRRWTAARRRLRARCCLMQH
jgi:hypothetical protein